jgi:hypothetical protein
MIPNILLSSKQVSDSLEEYLTSPNLSSSDIKNLLISQKHFIAAKEKIDEEEKDHLIIGSAIHCLVLEGRQEFNKRYFYFLNSTLPFPDKDMRNPQNKAAKQLALEEAKESKKTLIAEGQKVIIEACTKSIQENKTAMKILENTQSEQSFYYKLPFIDIEIPCKVRPDAISEKGGYYISLKTTSRDVSPAQWGKVCYNFNYHVSEAFYFAGLFRCLKPEFAINTGYYICVETSPPFISMVYEINNEKRDYISLFKEIADGNENVDLRYSEFLSVGMNALDRGFHRFRDLVLNGMKPQGYEYEIEKDDNGDMIIQQVCLPAWAISQETARTL